MKGMKIHCVSRLLINHNRVLIMKLLYLILISSTLMFGGSAHAQEQAAENDDERVHRSELRKERKAMKAEHRAKRVTKRMQMVDTNKDGKLDLNEYLQNAEQRFTDMDLDSDGYVTIEESSEWRKSMRSEHKQAMKAARKQNKQSAADSAEE
jgi:hypothetical protein